MTELETKVRSNLRAAIVALDALDDLCTVENGLGSEGIAAENAIDELIDNFSNDIRGRCEGCTKILFCGDKGHICYDGDPILCEECAYTWADVKAQYDKSEHGGDHDDRADFMKAFESHIASGGSADDKMLHEL